MLFYDNYQDILINEIPFDNHLNLSGNLTPDQLINTFYTVFNGNRNE